MKKYFSHGKLLITSEYMVLDGALSLALPTQLGQEMSVQQLNDKKNIIIWNGFHQGKEWLSVEFNYKTKQIIKTNLPQNAEFILKTFEEIIKQNDTKFQNDESYHFKTNLEFPSNFGLGSSSTLINNLAQWAEIDAFSLNENILGGSGYDIAVAMHHSPISYQIKENKRVIEKVEFSPSFKDEILFIHLNKKQDSREGIKLFQKKKPIKEIIDSFSEITHQVLKSNSIDEFSSLMELHEKKISELLEIPTAKELYFSDSPVFIKSLGTWGGDFIMTRKFENYEIYFKRKGFNQIFTCNELILNTLI